MWWTAHPKKSMCEIAIESQSKAIQKASRSTIPFRVLHPHIMSVHQNEDRDASARREDVSSTLTDHDVTEPSSSGIYSDFFIYREELATFVLAPPPQIPLDDPSTEVAASGSITCSTPEQIQDLQCLSSEELIDQLRPVAQILIDSLNFEQIKEFILSPKPKVGDPNRNPVTHCSRTNEEQESIASADGCFDNGDNDFPAATVQTNTPHATVPRRRDDVSALSEHVPSSSASTASTAPTNRTHESGGADLRAHVGDSHAIPLNTSEARGAAITFSQSDSSRGTPELQSLPNGDNHDWLKELSGLSEPVIPLQTTSIDGFGRRHFDVHVSDPCIMDANTGHVVQADLRTHEAPSTIYIPHHDPQLLSSTSYQVQVPHIHGTLHRTSTEDVLTAGQWPPLPVSTPNLRRTSTLPAYYPSTVSSPLPRLGSHYRVPSSSSMGSMTTSSSRSSSISPATPPIPESWNQASFLQYVPPAWPAAATSQLQPQAGPSRPDQFVNTSRSWTVPNNWDQSTAGTSSTLRTPTAFGAEPNASYGTRSMRIPEQQCSFQEYHGFQTQVASSPAVQLESRAGPSRTREPAKSQKRAAERSYDADKASRKSTTGRSSYEPGPSNFISPSSNIVNGNEDVTSETKICRWDGCGQAVLLTKKAPSKHYRQHHRFAEPKKRQVFCKWSGCGKDTLNESMERHYVRHFEIPHMCSICGQVFSRDDVVTRHNCKGTSNV